MGINSFSPACSRAAGITFFLAPLHALKSLFKPVEKTNSRLATNQALKNRTVRPCAIDTAVWRLGTIEKPINLSALKSRPPTRLRIVREFEPGVDTSCAGRMVISGRMADVCAELDRMTEPYSPANRH